MANIQDHPARMRLYNEFHARPFAYLEAPEIATHYAVLGDGADPQEDRKFLHRICERYGVASPPEDANHFQIDLGPVRLKWERHTEFVTYTFFRHGIAGDLFTKPAIDYVDMALIDGMPGRVLVATQLALVACDDPRNAPPENLAEHFISDSLCASQVADGAASMWTDFQVHGDGFGRIVVCDQGLGAQAAGRLAQRLLEIDTYRVLAMLALPVARESDPNIREIEDRLAEVTAEMNDAGGLEDEQKLLRRLTDISAAAEEATARSAYRFAAARAYHALVDERISELRETVIEGYQTIDAFMARRLAPAMRTCQAVAARQDTLARRVERAANLLRTRVDIAVEGQNRDLLASMNRRAKLQLRLQQTVEGLSIAAITYYVVSLVGYAAAAMPAGMLPLSVKTVQGLSIPVVLFLAWGGMYLLRRKLLGADRKDAD